MSGERLSPVAGTLNVSQQDEILSATAIGVSLDNLAGREGLSIADQIALQDAGLRQWMARRIVIVFIIANIATLAVVAGLVWLDQANIAAKLLSPAQRIIGEQVVLGLLGATTVQVGTVAVIMPRYLFPSRVSQD